MIVKVIKLHPKVISCATGPFQVFVKYVKCTRSLYTDVFMSFRVWLPSLLKPLSKLCRHDTSKNTFGLSYHPLFNMITNNSHFLGIEWTKTALISWLSNQDRDTVSMFTCLILCSNSTFSYQTPSLSQLPCCLDGLTPMILLLSLKSAWRRLWWSSSKNRILAWYPGRCEYDG
jgi:hypothetical protein